MNKNGATIIDTSHYMEEVEKLCDRVYIMDHGQIIASGTKEELKSILSNEEMVQIQVEQPNEEFAKRLIKLEGINQVTEDETGYNLITSNGEQLLGEIFEEAKQTQVKIIGVHIQAPTLEDVFLHLTGRKLRD